MSTTNISRDDGSTAAPGNIIFICTGNTCRSPMAEGLFRARGGETATGFTASSAGLFTDAGLPPTDNAVIAARELGADITAHRSVCLSPEMVHNATYLVCMTGAHYDRIRAAFPAAEDKLFLLMPTDVSDPFGGDLDTYRLAARQIDEGVQQVIARLRHD